MLPQYYQKEQFEQIPARQLTPEHHILWDGKKGREAIQIGPLIRREQGQIVLHLTLYSGHHYQWEDGHIQVLQANLDATPPYVFLAVRFRDDELVSVLKSEAVPPSGGSSLSVEKS